MDVVGSSAALLVLAPLFLLISVAIKLTSKGPVFYRQPRIGRHGVPFVCLKFRSMYLDSDSGVHEGYVRELIAGRDWLFQDDFYHIDVSHLGAVVQMSVHLPPGEELDLARELCAYGERLAPRLR